MRWLRWHAALSTPLLLVLGLAALGGPSGPPRFDEITVTRINVVDSAGRTRVLLAGGYPPRRGDLAGLLFINEDGHEAGGLVYRGTRTEDGTIRAGGILTFDQYRNDQVIALEYAHEGDRKRGGLTIQDRPDTLSDLVKEAYRAIETAPDATTRDSLTRYYRERIPPSDIASRRVFVGRDPAGAAVVRLSDPEGRVRLSMAVDSAGSARITFFGEDGTVTREFEP